MGEGSKAPLILGRPFLKTARENIDVGKGEIKFDINGTTSEFKFRPRLEVCNMINVKYVPPHRRVTEGKLKKEEESNKKEAKKEKEVVASIATNKIAAPVKIEARSTPVKTKKMTNLEDKPAPKSGYPRLQRHHRALVRSEEEESLAIDYKRSALREATRSSSQE